MASWQEHRYQFQPRPGKSVEKKCFALWFTNERLPMTHHPVGCFGEISLKLKPFREVQKGCGTGHGSQVLGIHSVPSISTPKFLNHSTVISSFIANFIFCGLNIHSIYNMRNRIKGLVSCNFSFWRSLYSSIYACQLTRYLKDSVSKESPLGS